MHHKRRKPKSSRAGCLLCKPHKHQTLHRAERQRDKRKAMQVERSAW